MRASDKAHKTFGTVALLPSRIGERGRRLSQTTPVFGRRQLDEKHRIQKDIVAGKTPGAVQEEATETSEQDQALHRCRWQSQNASFSLCFVLSIIYYCHLCSRARLRRLGNSVDGIRALPRRFWHKLNIENSIARRFERVCGLQIFTAWGSFSNERFPPPVGTAGSRTSVVSFLPSTTLWHLVSLKRTRTCQSAVKDNEHVPEVGPPEVTPCHLFSSSR